MVQNLLQRHIHFGPMGASDEERRRGWTLVLGEVADEAGGRAVSRLRGPDGYRFTVHAALAVVGRVPGEQALPGFQMPALT